MDHQDNSDAVQPNNKFKQILFPLDHRLPKLTHNNSIDSYEIMMCGRHLFEVHDTFFKDP